MEKWIITCNPDYYDVIEAFNSHKLLNWKQSVNVQVGDIVYIYVGAPYSAIMFETKVLAVNLPEVKIYDQDFVKDGTTFEHHGRYMEIELIERFDEELLKFKALKKYGLKSVQGPSRVSDDLDTYIQEMKSNLIGLDSRKYFFVFQNKSFDQEFAGGYLWSPQFNKNGHRTSHYEQMKNVRKGDLIIHSFNKKISAISIALTDVYESDRPLNSGVHDDWDVKGWRVDTKYYRVSNPIITSEHIDKIMQLQPDKNAPFNKAKRGNTGYLYAANRELANYIIEETINVANIVAEKEILIRLLNNEGTESDEKQLDQDLLDDVDVMLKSVKSSNFEYVPEPKDIPKPQWTKGKKTYPRDRKVAMNALVRAKHKCEIDPNHPSFIRKSTGENYSEPHHLIPLSKQDVFSKSLDVEANIVSLCSNCHNEIHYGINRIDIVEKLFNLRKKELKLAGILTDVENLKVFYDN